MMYVLLGELLLLLLLLLDHGEHAGRLLVELLARRVHQVVDVERLAAENKVSIPLYNSAYRSVLSFRRP